MINLPAQTYSGITLILAPRALRREWITLLTVRLALLGPVQVLDGGNSFDALKLARELRRASRRYHAALSNVSVARAFTCHQMLALLTEIELSPTPLIAPELLSTFADENVPEEERRHLLQGCLTRLETFRAHASVFISAEPADDVFTAILQTHTDRLWQYELPQPVTQPRLF